MCGLVGMAGNLSTPHYKIFRMLLLMDTIRGYDSTGVAAVPKVSNTPKIHKEVGTPYDLFMADKGFDQNGLLLGSHKVLIGHNRAATMGVVDKESAHPFTYGDVTGAHNGTLRNWTDLENYSTHDIDSEAIFDTIDRRGVEDTWSSFTGAAALTWWNSWRGELHLLRNEERPLYVATIDNGAVMMWASLEWMLKAAALCVGKELDDDSFGLKAPFSLKTHSHHTFELSTTTFRPRVASTKTLTPKAEYTMYHPSSNWVKRKGPEKTATVPSKPINVGWAKDLEKAGKDVVGREFVIASCLTTYNPEEKGGPRHIIKGCDFQGNLVEVYPSSMDVWTDLSKRLYNKSMAKNFKMLVRPRLKGGAYLISSLGIEEVKEKEYLDFNNLPTTKEVAETDLKSRANDECSMCGSPLEAGDDYRYIYQGWAVCCDECDKNGSPFLEMYQ